MKTETPITHVPGIYIISCSENGKVYVGKTSDCLRRMKSHRYHLRKGNHTNLHLQRAWNAYGEDTFKFEILEIVEDPSARSIREICAIQDLGALDKELGFNLKDPSDEVPESPDPRILEGVGLPPRNETTMRAAATPDPSVLGKTRAKMSVARQGVPKSEDTRLKMSVAAEIRKKNAPFAYEHVRAVRLAYTKPLYHRPGGVSLLARHLGLPYAQVYKIVNSLTWSRRGRVGATPEYGGHLHVITGPMFASKTTELLRLLRVAKRDGKRTLCIKPEVDDRHLPDRVVTHAGRQTEALQVSSAKQIPHLVQKRGANVVGIDEVQFFGDDIVGVCHDLANASVDVFVVGLNMDYRGNPFNPMPALLATAETVDLRQAFCMVCGGPASRTQRITNSDEQVLIGAAGVYEARCRSHWSPRPVFRHLET